MHKSAYNMGRYFRSTHVREQKMSDNTSIILYDECNKLFHIHIHLIFFQNSIHMFRSNFLPLVQCELPKFSASIWKNSDAEIFNIYIYRLYIL